MPGMLAGSLANRLRVVDWIARHPEVADERIDAPLVVIGMFRAGTTFLSYLLDQDPAQPRAACAGRRATAFRRPRRPTTAPVRASTRSHAGNDMLEQINPRIEAIHHEEPDGPTECIAVMSQDFKSLSWEAIANVPAYGEWLLGVDQRSAYEYHRSVLQVLQSGGVRGRWTLKSPHHAIALDALTAVYPDARLVLLHRDPVVLCASVCSLITTLSATFTDADHRAYIARHWVAMLEESIRRIDAFRAAHPEHPIVDVQYDDLVPDPVATVDVDLRARVRRRARRHRRRRRSRTTSPRTRRASLGAHRYDLAEFGLDAGELAERFAALRRPLRRPARVSGWADRRRALRPGVVPSRAGRPDRGTAARSRGAAKRSSPSALTTITSSYTPSSSPPVPSARHWSSRTCQVAVARSASAIVIRPLRISCTHKRKPARRSWKLRAMSSRPTMVGAPGIDHTASSAQVSANNAGSLRSTASA